MERNRFFHLLHIGRRFKWQDKTTRNLLLQLAKYSYYCGWEEKS